MSAPLTAAALDRLAAWEEGGPAWYRGDPSLLDVWPDEFHAMRDLAAECIALRATNARLNRRVQEMESAVHRVERIEARIAERVQGKPLGRIEAGFAIAAAQADRDALRAQLADAERERDEAVERVAEVEAAMRDWCVCIHCGERFRADSAETETHGRDCQKHPQREVERDRDALAAQVAALREALVACKCECVFAASDFGIPAGPYVAAITCARCAALAATSADSLAAHDAAVRAQERERCAEVATRACPCWGDKATGPEACGEGGNPHAVCELHAMLAAAIRALPEPKEDDRG